MLRELLESSSIQFAFLSDDVYINGRCIAEEMLDRRQVKASPPATRRRVAKDHLSDPFFLHEICNRLGDVSAFQAFQLGFQVFGKVEVGLQIPPLLFVIVFARVDVYSIQLGVDGACHAGRSRDQVL